MMKNESAGQGCSAKQMRNPSNASEGGKNGEDFGHAGSLGGWLDRLGGGKGSLGEHGLQAVRLCSQNAASQKLYLQLSLWRRVLPPRRYGWLSDAQCLGHGGLRREMGYYFGFAHLVSV